MLHTLARPFMRGWYLSREAALGAVPFPQDAPVARVPGPDPVRVLLVGNGAATGWGVRSHDLALTGQLARALAASTGRGVQVDARVDGTVRIAGLARLLDGVDLRRYAAVVLVAGMSDALNLTPLRSWQAALEDLLVRVRAGAPGAAVLVAGPQSVRSVPLYRGWPSAVAEAHRLAINRVSAAVCADRGVAFGALPVQPAPAEGHRSPAEYGGWADVLVARLRPLLADAAAGEEQRPEAERQRATETMLPDAPPDPGLDRITRLARSVLGAEVAALTMLDGDVQRYRSVIGSDVRAVPRSTSVCDHTIRGGGALVIGDLAADPRFAGAPFVLGERRIRFYAGYPIESPDGHRVGALCVLDTQPRDPADVDLAALSDLALLAQKELWTSVERAAAG